MKKYFFDILLGVFIIVLSVSIMLGLASKTKEDNLYAVIYYKNIEYDRINLSEVTEKNEKTYDFDGRIVVIEYAHNIIKVKSAECHDHTCEKMGSTSSSNKPIICLDIGFMIKIESSEDNIDVVVG